MGHTSTGVLYSGVPQFSNLLQHQIIQDTSDESFRSKHECNSEEADNTVVLVVWVLMHPLGFSVTKSNT